MWGNLWEIDKILDILLMASDGLFDNVSDQEILKALEETNSENLKEKSVRLAAFCINQALDPHVFSLFALNARKEDYATEGKIYTRLK